MPDYTTGYLTKINKCMKWRTCRIDFPICLASITLIRSDRDRPRRVFGADDEGCWVCCAGAAIVQRATAAASHFSHQNSCALVSRFTDTVSTFRCCVRTIREWSKWLAKEVRVRAAVEEEEERLEGWKSITAWGCWLKEKTMWRLSCTSVLPQDSRSLNWNSSPPLRSRWRFQGFSVYIICFNSLIETGYVHAAQTRPMWLVT